MEDVVGLQRQIWQKMTLEQAQSHRTQQLVGLRSWIFLLSTTKRDWKVLTYNKYCFLSRLSISVFFFVVKFIPLFADRRPTKLQIKEVIDNSNESASENDVEFIIQVNFRSLWDFVSFKCCLSQCCNFYLVITGIC